MSRHKRHVPTGFYKKFTKAACDFADRYAQGRLVSVLEGGYSDRALISGAMSHLAGFAEAAGQVVDPRWWTSEELFKVDPASLRCLSCLICVLLVGKVDKETPRSETADGPPGMVVTAGESNSRLSQPGSSAS